MAEIRETAIFMIRKNGMILCEWREFKGVMRHCILGGKVEAEDRLEEDFRQATVIREAMEEVGISVDQCVHISTFKYEDRPIHLMLVENWQGEIAEENRDNNNRLHWVEQYELAESITMEPLKHAVDRFLGS